MLKIANPVGMTGFTTLSHRAVELWLYAAIGIYQPPTISLSKSCTSQVNSSIMKFLLHFIRITHFPIENNVISADWRIQDKKQRPKAEQPWKFRKRRVAGSLCRLSGYETPGSRIRLWATAPDQKQLHRFFISS